MSWTRAREALYLGGLVGTAGAVLLGLLDVVSGRLIPLIAALSWLPFFVVLTLSKGQPVRTTRARTTGETILQVVAAASWVLAGFLALWGAIEWNVASFVALTGMLPWSIFVLITGRHRAG